MCSMLLHTHFYICRLQRLMRKCYLCSPLPTYQKIRLESVLEKLFAILFGNIYHSPENQSS